MSMKCIILINVKMSTIVDILIFSSMIKTSSQSLKAKKVFIFQHFSFYAQLNFMLSWVEHGKSFITRFGLNISNIKDKVTIQSTITMMNVQNQQTTREISCSTKV